MTSEDRQRGSKRIRIVIGTLVALGAVGVAVAAAVGVADLPGSGSRPDAGPQTPAPSSAPDSPIHPGVQEGAGHLEEESAERVVEAALSMPLDGAETSDELHARAANTAVDGFLAELETQWQELLAYGWAIEGKPKVISTEIERIDEEKGSAVVTGCIDSSQATMVDAAGDPIGGDADRDGPATQIFTLLQGDDGIWRVAQRSFPENPAC